LGRPAYERRREKPLRNRTSRNQAAMAGDYDPGSRAPSRVKAASGMAKAVASEFKFRYPYGGLRQAVKAIDCEPPWIKAAAAGYRAQACAELPRVW
jgi:hypothetical protein